MAKKPVAPLSDIFKRTEPVPETPTAEPTAPAAPKPVATPKPKKPAQAKKPAPAKKAPRPAQAPRARRAAPPAQDPKASDADKDITLHGVGVGLTRDELELVDRLAGKMESRSRVAESVEVALRYGSGALIVFDGENRGGSSDPEYPSRFLLSVRIVL